MQHRRPCKFYPNCSKGDDCPFLHEDSNSSSHHQYSTARNHSPYSYRSHSRSPSPHYHHSNRYRDRSRSPKVVQQDLSTSPLFSFGLNQTAMPTTKTSSRTSNIIPLKPTTITKSEVLNSSKYDSHSSSSHYEKPFSQKSSYIVNLLDGKTVEFELCMCSCDKIFWTRDLYEKHKLECRSEGNIQWSKVFGLLYRIVHTTDLNPIVLGKIEATILRAKADNVSEAVYYLEKLKDTICPFIKEVRKDEKINTEAERRRYLEYNKYCEVLLDVITTHLQRIQHTYEMNSKASNQQSDNPNVQFFS